MGKNTIYSSQLAQITSREYDTKRPFQHISSIASFKECNPRSHTLKQHRKDSFKKNEQTLSFASRPRSRYDISVWKSEPALTGPRYPMSPNQWKDEGNLLLRTIREGTIIQSDIEGIFLEEPQRWGIHHSTHFE
jgi:hypothetical protein